MSVVHQPFIASYQPDFVWLEYLLRSLRLRARGFADPVICVPESDREEAVRRFPGTTVAVQDSVPEGATKWRRFLAAQVAMMECDVHCPTADFVWLFGSDCFVTDSLYPEMGMRNGRPVMPSNTYAHLGPGSDWWRDGTEKALGVRPIEREFMRQLPLVYPRHLYQAVRAHVVRTHGSPFREYVYGTAREGNKFSESNVLGAFAWTFRREAYEWVDFDAPGASEAYAYPVRQFWSHGGIDGPGSDYPSYFRRAEYVGTTARKYMEASLGGVA